MSDETECLISKGLIVETTHIFSFFYITHYQQMDSIKQSFTE